MSISRLTRERLYQDESIFNQLLPYAKYDPEFRLFIHSDASLWSIWELEPQWITKTSDTEAYKMCAHVQEMLDSFDEDIAAQLCWITTFDVDGILKQCVDKYPTTGPAGWMARRWVRMLRRSASSHAIHRRPRKLRLVIAFRYDPPWRSARGIQQLIRTVQIMFTGQVGVSAQQRKSEYRTYANEFKGLIDGNVQKLADLGFRPRLIDGQGIINLMYPLLNRRSVKAGKFRRGRNTNIPVPAYDPHDFLANQLSETSVEHPRAGIIKKDGRVYRTVSMVKGPKQCLPLMISPLLSSPYENLLSVTFSKDPREDQLKRLDKLDKSLGFQEFGMKGRTNQKVQHQIAAIRAARSELYSARSQIVRIGVHQTFFCQTEEEAVRASSEAMATFPHLNGARGMVHEIADMGVMISTFPGCYDPANDGPGWTTMMRSSRAVRMFPMWGNWKGSKGPLFVLPSLWNRELVGFDFYDSETAPNILISGVSGAGKSYLLCYILITMNRGHYATLADGSVKERPPITFVFDKGMAGQPCGFEKVARLFGGRVYEATPSKAPSMNFLARLGETPPDPRNEDYKDLIDMSADIICDMAVDGNRHLERLDKQAVTGALVEAHKVYRNGPMRREFILTDVVSSLQAPKGVTEDEDSARRRRRVALLIGDYYGDGTFARFFDKPGSLKLAQRFIVFDLKALSRNPDLQRVFLKVAMLWADTVMNDPVEQDCRKVLVFDEAHDLIGKNDSSTIETAFRLYRKRKGIVIAASQSGEDFYVGTGGQAIVQNSAHKIFLRQDPSKFHLTAQAFNLSEQQSDIMLRIKTVKGIESQFYLMSDIGEGALCLPLESAFYWASTNNGDDNQLFDEIVQRCGGDFFLALQEAVRIAPSGAKAYQEAHLAANSYSGAGEKNITNIVRNLMDDAVDTAVQ